MLEAAVDGAPGRGSACVIVARAALPAWHLAAMSAEATGVCAGGSGFLDDPDAPGSVWVSQHEFAQRGGCTIVSQPN
jgi:hypothetical protein